MNPVILSHETLTSIFDELVYASESVTSFHWSETVSREVDEKKYLRELNLFIKFECLTRTKVKCQY